MQWEAAAAPCMPENKTCIEIEELYCENRVCVKATHQGMVGEYVQWTRGLSYAYSWGVHVRRDAFFVQTHMAAFHVTSATVLVRSESFVLGSSVFVVGI